MSKKKLKNGIKRHKNSITISVTLPENIYLMVKQCAQDEIRNINQQARFFLEAGIAIINQQSEESNVQQQSSNMNNNIPPERESAIGFRLYDDDIDEDDNDD